MKPIPAALCSPMAIEPQWLRVMFGVWSRGRIDAAALAQAKAQWEARQQNRPKLSEPGAPVEGTGGTLRIVGDVGVISVEGPLFRHANLISDFSGGTTYDAIWRGIEASEAHPQVSRSLFRFNTPGGEADGLSELAEAVSRLRKPTWAYVDGMCASAGYWLASQCDHIVAELASEVGSIGVRAGTVDDSVADEMAGIREIEIISSQSPGKRSKPVDDEVIGRLQTRIDDLAELFIAAVARGRGVSAKTVLEGFGQGDVMIASKALDAGLIDEIGNFNGTLAALAASATSGRAARAEGRTMKIETSSSKPAAGGDAPEWQCAGCSEMMGPSAKAYCAKCAEPDEDGDEDEEEAKALGLDPKASLGARRARAQALVALEGQLFALSGVASHEDLLESVKAGAAARGEIARVIAAGNKATLRMTLERGLAGAPGKQPTLSLGQIQKHMTVALRGPAKKAWSAAMDALAASADEAHTTITAAQILDAACSVDLSGEDLESVQDYVATSPAVAAATHVEPARDGSAESDELSPEAMRVKQEADKARAALDRNKPAAK